jgi:photosystem II stability/assembly factor-like uncharacterized protein
MSHKRFQTCHAHGVIDAEIVEKGHFWTETSYGAVLMMSLAGQSISRDISHETHENRPSSGFSKIGR